jgi:hypothetical protein
MLKPKLYCLREKKLSRFFLLFNDYRYWLQDTVKTAGAEVSEEGIIETFHNDEEALDAADNGVVVSILFCYLFIPVAKCIFSFSLQDQLYLVEAI